MAETGSVVHLEQAAHAERLADEARLKLDAARSAAERHERLASHVDAAAGGTERNAQRARLYRDAEQVYRAAVALHSQHAVHERLAATRLARHADRPTTPAPGEALSDLTSRYAQLARQEAQADERDTEADERDRIADERDRIADEREAVVTSREDQLDAHQRQLEEASQFIHDQRARIAEAQAAVARTRDRLSREVEALDRAGAALARPDSRDNEPLASRGRRARP
jgi:hypothetical protein